VGAVDTLALVVVGRAPLFGSIDLGVRRVKIDGRTLRAKCGAAALWHEGEGALDERGIGPLHLGTGHLVEALAERDHRGRRRYLGHGTQRQPGGVIALEVEVAQEVTAGEHRLGQCDHDSAEHETALALFEGRPGTVDDGRDPEQLVELGHEV